MILAVVLSMAGVGPTDICAQEAPPRGPPETVESIRLIVDLTAADGSASVAAEYRLRNAVPGRPVAVEYLMFDGRRPGGLADEHGPVRLELRGARTLIGTATPTFDGPDGGAVVRLRYRVEDLIDPTSPTYSGRLGVVGVDRDPAEPRPGLFSAEIRMPPTWVLSETFPTAVVELGGGRFRTDLPVAPAMIGLRGRTTGAWAPGLPWLLDGFALLGLTAFAIGGWRHLRGRDARRAVDAVGGGDA